MLKPSLLLAFVVLMTSTLWCKDPVVGEWRLDPIKSTVTNGVRYVDGTISAIDNGDGSLSLRYERIRADGKAISLRYTYRADGSDYPASGGEEGLTVSRKAIGHDKFQTVWKIHGKVITISRNSYSKDLQTLTNRAHNVDEKGQGFDSVTVWHRVK